jgi:polyhydroxyalkanoate synthase subunit PhaC
LFTAVGVPNWGRMSEPQDSDGAGPGAARPDPEAFARVGKHLAALSQDISDIAKLAAGASPGGLETAAAAAAYKALNEAYASRPQALADAQLDLFNRQSNALQAMAAGQPAPDADADTRFSDPAWRDNPFYDFIRRTFLTTAAWAENLAETAPGLDDLERRRAVFFIRQAFAAMAPSNTLLGNPKALKEMFDSEGASLQRGLDLLRQDVGSGERRLNVPQTDSRAFELGVNLAVTPGEVVYKNELIELIRYRPSTDQVRASPLLIFPPWINKYYVLDLTPQNSLVAWLRDQGHVVYMVSWRSADAETKDYGWDEYLARGARAALEWVHAAHEAPVNAAGYCVGGALLSILAARLAATDDRRLASISLLAAQTDFSEPGDLGLFIDRASLAGVERLISDSGGIMPGEGMRDAFNLLRPQDLIWRYVEERYLLGREPRAFDLLYWNSDQTNLPGRLHLQSLERLYLDNALARGVFEVEGAQADLKAVAEPVFLHAALKDHISPFPSVYKGTRLFGGEVTFVLADSGHIAGVVNPPAAQKYRFWTGPAHSADANAWLEAAREQPGSWWPVWGEWLESHAGGWRAPPPAVEGAPPAPGDYVRETLDSIRRRQAG